MTELRPGEWRCWCGSSYIHAASCLSCWRCGAVQYVVTLPDGPAGKYGEEAVATQKVSALVRDRPARVIEQGFPGRDVTSSVLAPAHSGAGGLGWNSEASPEEPESLERLLGPIQTFRGTGEG